jgi:hypothetical protein
VSQLPRKCGSLDVSQPYEPPLPLAGILLPFLPTEYVAGCPPPLRGGLNVVEEIKVDASVGNVTVDIYSHHLDEDKTEETGSLFDK